MAGDLIPDIDRRIAGAQRRYGPLTSTHEGLGVALEEWNELQGAVHANDLAAVEKECLDLAAVLIRMARALHNRENTIMNRSTK